MFQQPPGLKCFGGCLFYWFFSVKSSFRLAPDYNRQLNQNIFGTEHIDLFTCVGANQDGVIFRAKKVPLPKNRAAGNSYCNQAARPDFLFRRSFMRTADELVLHSAAKLCNTYCFIYRVIAHTVLDPFKLQTE